MLTHTLKPRTDCNTHTNLAEQIYSSRHFIQKYFSYKWLITFHIYASCASWRCAQ